MGSLTHGLSPVLPGAWSSTWALSPDQETVDVDRTPRLTRPHMPYSVPLQHHEHFVHTRSETLDSKGAGCDAAPARDVQADDEAEDVSSMDDDSSVLSEDFYSFISHQDTDTTLLPSSVMSMSLPKENESSDGPLGALDFSGPSFDSSDLGSSLHVSTTEDVLVSDVLSSVHEAPVSTHIHLSSTDDVSSSVYNHANDARPTSPLGFTLPNISACGQRLTAPLAIDAVTRMSSGSSVDPAGYECDSASAHSDYSDINFTGISNLISRLEAGHASRASDVSWSQSSARDAARHAQTRRGADYNTRRPPLNSQPSTLSLAQPDGDNPWTLYLDPTLTSTESDAVSRSSVSLSLDSSFALDADRISVTSRQIATSNVSLRSPFARSDGPPATPTFQQGRHSPVYGQYVPPQSGSVDPGPSTVTISPNTESVHSKNFLQKTKNLCNKFKKFITLKAKKERKVTEPKEISDIHRTVLHDHHLPEAPTPLQHFPQMMPPSSSSIERTTLFQRTAKISSQSIALSYTPEYTTGRSTQNSDEKLTYEYHARPKTLQEIKSKRRFSLPVFAGSSSAGPSTPKNIAPSPTTRRRKAGSILSAEGRTMR